MSALYPSSINAISTYLFEMVGVLARIPESSIEETIDLLYRAWSERRRIFIMGNGGSASTASHLANDLAKGAIVSGKPRVKAIALTDNISLISAWANDTSYENIFKEQLENLLEKGDLVLGISASGNSPNILQGLEFARRQEAVTIGWSGLTGGKLKDIVDLAVLAPTDDVGMIESCHMVLDHLVAAELRRRIENGTDQPSERRASLQKTAFLKRDRGPEQRILRTQVPHAREPLVELDEVPVRGNGGRKNKRGEASESGSE